MSATEFEPGTFNNVFVNEAGDIAKITRRTFSLDAANFFCDRLVEYHAAAASGPLATAELLSVGILEADEGEYRVQHELEFVQGRAVSELPYEERLTVVAGLAQIIAGAPRRSPGELQQPLDAKTRNFRMRGTEPVLVDYCPPFYWDGGGNIADGTPEMPSADALTNMTRRFGRVSGALAELLAGIVPPIAEGSPSSHLEQLLADMPNWYRNLLPTNLSGEQRAETQQLLVETLQAQLFVARKAERSIARLREILGQGIIPEEK